MYGLEMFEFFTSETRVCLLLRRLLWLFTGNKQKIYGRNRSMIRRMASLLPFLLQQQKGKSLSGMRFSSVFSNRMLNATESSLIDGRSTSFSVISSTPIKSNEDKILSLEQEIQNLKKLMSQLVIHYGDNPGICGNDAPSLSHPPLASLEICSHSVLKKEALGSKESDRKYLNEQENNIFSEKLPRIVQDIRNVKLHEVKRTPADTHSKYPNLSFGSTNDLKAVLQKRFNALHCESPRGLQNYSYDEDSDQSNIFDME